MRGIVKAGLMLMTVRMAMPVLVRVAMIVRVPAIM
jgi:hypothetical protein